MASERAFEKIIEAVNDLAILVLKGRGVGVMFNSMNVFNDLSEEGIIGEDLLYRLRKAMGMRNFIVHQYGKIDDWVVFSALKNHLFSDVEEFLERVGAL